MLTHKTRSCTTVLAVVFLVVLALIPWAINASSAPLRPPELEQTALLYATTEVYYTTRQAAEERAATSIFETLPPENNGSGQLGVATSTPKTESGDFPTKISGISPDELSLYRCPFPSDLLGDRLPANQKFTVLGWNIDADGNNYFLIEDDPTRNQVWIQYGPTVVIVQPYNFDPRHPELLFPKGSGCRTWTTNALALATPSPALISLSPTPTISLPTIKTATPLPPEQVRVELTEEDAAAQIEEDIPDLNNPKVHFSPDGIQITGDVKLSTVLGNISGEVEIVGQLETRNKKLFMNITSLTARGKDYTDKDERRQVEDAVNNWLAKLLIRREVQSFELQEGLLIINVLERQESILPTLPATLAEEVISVSPTPTIPLPEARPITITPRSSAPFQISDEEATAHAADHLTEIVQPQVHFTTNGIEIQGKITIPGVVAGQTVSGSVTVTGQLEIQNGQLHMTVSEFTINGVSTSEFGTKNIIEDAINTWLPTLAGGSFGQFELEQGNLILLP